MPVRPFTQDDLRWLVCSVCHHELRLVSSQDPSPDPSQHIQCTGCARQYPFVHGLPVLLPPS